MNDMFGFEMKHGNNWTLDGVGIQDPSNLFETEEAAKRELPALASALGCDVSELRVSPFRNRNGSWLPLR